MSKIYKGRRKKSCMVALSAVVIILVQFFPFFRILPVSAATDYNVIIGEDSQPVEPAQQTSTLFFGVTIHSLAIQEIQDGPFSYAKVTWFTNVPATSRVVIDAFPHPYIGIDTNYGYASSTSIIDANEKVTYHVVFAGPLQRGSTYYFRPVSNLTRDRIGDEIFLAVSPTKEIIPTSITSESQQISADLSTDLSAKALASEEASAKVEEIYGIGGEYPEQRKVPENVMSKKAEQKNTPTPKRNRLAILATSTERKIAAESLEPLNTTTAATTTSEEGTSGKSLLWFLVIIAAFIIIYIWFSRRERGADELPPSDTTGSSTGEGGEGSVNNSSAGSGPAGKGPPNDSAPLKSSSLDDIDKKDILNMMK